MRVHRGPNPERNGLTDEECTEVVHILDMHRALKRSYEALSDKGGIEERLV